MTILIAGGTGLIGKRLTELLLKDGHTVHILTRQKLENTSKIKYFQWDVGQFIEEGAFFNDPNQTTVDGIINLTGAGIADKKWSAKRKKEIIESRVKPAQYIEEHLTKLNVKVPVYLSASGVNYYDNSASKIYNEKDAVGNDFVQHVCDLWEEQAFKMSNVANRIVVMRTGVVLAKKESFLQKFTATTSFFVAGVFGSGKQYLSWIHIDDLCRFYIQALENQSMNGAFNAAICNNESHNSFLMSFKKATGKSFIIAKAPAFVANAVFGEMATLLTAGVAVSNQKMIDTGFKLQFDTVEKAVSDLV